MRREKSLFPVELSAEAARWVVRITKIAEEALSVPLSPGTTYLDGVLVDWANRTELPEMLDVEVSRTTKDRLYRVSDELLKHRKKIEKTLRSGEQELFSFRRSIVLYDVTNTHFKGLCRRNPKAKHGKNKQKHTDCRQVAVGMAFDEHGFALAHEVFEGNMTDTKTLLCMLERLDLEDEKLKPVVIIDAGFASEENIRLLEERGCSYIINITRGSRSRYAQYFENETFTALPGRKPSKQVEVKRIDDPDNEQCQLVLCRSALRREKEQAILSKAEEHFLADGKALRKHIEAGRLKKSDVTNDFVVPQKTRLLQHNGLCNQIRNLG